MMLTICGTMEGWDIVKCRTVSLTEAMDAWGEWLPLILNGGVKVGPYSVWVA